MRRNLFTRMFFARQYGARCSAFWIATNLNQMSLSGHGKRWYQKIFQKHLFITNTTSCCLLLGLGDWIQQKLESKSLSGIEHNWQRTGRMMTMGLALGPMAHVWYGFLDRLYPVTTARAVAKKILLDQTIAAPSFSFTFITGVCMLEGQKFKPAFEEFKSKFPMIYLVDWFVWPPTQVINFYFMPPQFRVINQWKCLRNMCEFFNKLTVVKLEDFNEHAPRG